jgi:6-phospho-3-hexuloisomerase
MFHELAKTITTEIVGVLDGVTDSDAVALVRAIKNARCIVVVGAGRVGLVCKAFAMRLGHLGFVAFTPSDSTASPIGNGDVLIVGSSSGETQTIYDVCMLGKTNGAYVIAITADTESRMAKVADAVVELQTPTKFGVTKGIGSIQPMATLFEQSLNIVFDIVVLMLMDETRQNRDDLWKRHTNLD